MNPVSDRTVHKDCINDIRRLLFELQGSAG